MADERPQHTDHTDRSGQFELTERELEPVVGGNVVQNPTTFPD
jgi:hypothetical protein